MFTSSLTEEVKVLEEDIEAVKDKVDDPVMCEKIRQFVYASREIQEKVKTDAGTSTFHLYYFIQYHLISRLVDQPQKKLAFSQPLCDRGIGQSYHVHNGNALFGHSGLMHCTSSTVKHWRTQTTMTDHKTMMLGCLKTLEY